jgi:TRAP-type transport system small permease protein
MRKYKLVVQSNKVNKFIQKCEISIGVLSLIVMLSVMVLNIFFRYILNKPIAWSDELSNYLFIWMSFLSSAYVMGNDAHVRVVAIESRLPSKVRYIIHFFMNCIMMMVFCCYIGPTFRMLNKLKDSNMMRIPLKFVYIIMPVAFLLICIHIVNNIIQDIYHIKNERGKQETLEKNIPNRRDECC